MGTPVVWASFYLYQVLSTKERHRKLVEDFFSIPYHRDF